MINTNDLFIDAHCVSKAHKNVQALKIILVPASTQKLAEQPHH
jgi:hypothetical protein